MNELVTCFLSVPEVGNVPSKSERDIYFFTPNSLKLTSSNRFSTLLPVAESTS